MIDPVYPRDRPTIGGPPRRSLFKGMGCSLLFGTGAFLATLGAVTVFKALIGFVHGN